MRRKDRYAWTVIRQATVCLPVASVSVSVTT